MSLRKNSGNFRQIEIWIMLLAIFATAIGGLELQVIFSDVSQSFKPAYLIYNQPFSCLQIHQILSFKAI